MGELEGNGRYYGSDVRRDLFQPRIPHVALAAPLGRRCARRSTGTVGRAILHTLQATISVLDGRGERAWRETKPAGRSLRRAGGAARLRRRRQAETELEISVDAAARDLLDLGSMGLCAVVYSCDWRGDVAAIGARLAPAHATRRRARCRCGNAQPLHRIQDDRNPTAVRVVELTKLGETRTHQLHEPVPHHDVDDAARGPAHAALH